ncbi:SYP52 [Scenedesmus sp. PABB004]|nr:SYP52 [Scenedesmus sp. PABB004]
MPSGFRLDTDAWLKEYEKCKDLTQEIVTLVQERNLQHPDGGPEASRMTANARRKLGTLGTSLDQLFRWIDSPEAAALSEQERFRRRDLLHALKHRREQVQQSIKRGANSSDRESLLAGGGGPRQPARETEATAELDGRGLVQLQQAVMAQQDQELEQMERTVISTKHIALTIGEEVDLHTRLLTELDEDVDVTHTRLRAATKRVRHVLRHSSNWKGGLCIFMLIICLTLLLLVAFKVIRLFKEDEFDVTYVYGRDAEPADVHARSIAPLVRKLVEGYNVAVLLFGATGAGKTSTLEGARARAPRPGGGGDAGAEGDGLVHHAIDELFALLHGKAVSIGEAVAKRRRVPAARGFDWFVESSFVELYDEAAHDLLARDAAAAAAALPVRRARARAGGGRGAAPRRRQGAPPPVPLHSRRPRRGAQVAEDETEGPVVTGLTARPARGADELRAAFNAGAAARDSHRSDLGSVHERAAALFTVSVAQHAPAAVHGEEDRVMVSRLTFVDLPGAERLAMDPEVLRLREGLSINRGLLALARVLRALAQDGGGGGGAFAGHDDSLLTRLLAGAARRGVRGAACAARRARRVGAAHGRPQCSQRSQRSPRARAAADALGGNCLTLLVGAVRVGDDFESTSATLRQLAVARGVRNFPIINHSRARGLLKGLRHRLHAVMPASPAAPRARRSAVSAREAEQQQPAAPRARAGGWPRMAAPGPGMGAWKLAWMVFAYVWMAIASGWIKLPLPYPAVNQYAHPVPGHVYPWRPGSLDKGRFKVRTRLNATRLFEGVVTGSESVTSAPDGRFIMLDRYGAVRAAVPVPGAGRGEAPLVLEPRPVAHLGPGRPLGAAYDAAGNLIVCDSLKGLVMLEAGSGRVVLLTSRVSKSSPSGAGSLLNYVNDLDIAPDGTVYFTDSVDIHPHRNAQPVNDVTHIISIQGDPGFYDTAKSWALGMLQGLPRGRLLAYFPGNRSTHVVSEGFYYPNGVALGPDGTWLALAETDRLRVLKVWLPPHPAAGRSEVLIDDLPGTPDGIHHAHGGGFWVSLLSNIPGYTRWFGMPLVRGVLGWIPENRRPQVPSWGAVLKVTADGRVLQWLVDLKGESVAKIPSAHEAGGRLFFGNLAGRYVSYIDLDTLPPDGAEEDRELLRDQLRAAPAEGDPQDRAISIAKLRDLEARLLEEREEKVALAGEKALLAARLAKLKDAGTDELRERGELQEALVRSEEQRLEVSRALIDFEVETNEARAAWAKERFALEQRILELESGRLEHHVRREDHAALADERDALAAQLRAQGDATARAQAALDAERETSAAAQAELRRLNQLLAALEAAAAGDASALLLDHTEDGGGQPGSAAALRSRAAAGLGGGGGGAGTSAGGGAARINLAEVRLQLQRQLKQQERRIGELESQLAEATQGLEAAQAARSSTQEALDQARSLFRRRMEGAAREVADLSQRVAVAAGDPGHLLALGPDELLARVSRFIDELLQAAGDAAGETRRDAEALAARHATLRRRLRTLYAGYRALRYRVEDEWPASGAGAPPRVAHEDAVLGGSVDEVIRADDDADRQALVRQQQKVAALEAVLAGLKVKQLEWDTMGAAGAGKLSAAKGQPGNGNSSGAGAAPAALMLENARLREELDGLRRRLPQVGLLRRSGSSVGDGAQATAAAGGALEQLTQQLAQLRAENQRLQAAAARGGAAAAAAAAAGGAPGRAGVGSGAGSAELRRQVKEFTLNTQLELEQKLKAVESRAVMAEEQLAHLQRYMATASVTYQREIVRLRAALGGGSAAAGQ